MLNFLEANSKDKVRDCEASSSSGNSGHSPHVPNAFLLFSELKPLFLPQCLKFLIPSLINDQ